MSEKTGFVSNVLANIVATLAAGAIVATLSYCAVWAVSLKFQFLKPHVILGTILVASAVALLLVAVWKRKNRFRPSFPQVDCDYAVIRKEISINLASTRKIVYTKTFELRALRNNLTHFEDKYRWSGKIPPLKIECDQKQFSVIPTVTLSLWNLYEVQFDRQYKKNEVIKFKVIWTIEDPEMSHSPFVSTTINEPTDDLTLSVQFGKSFGVAEVLCEQRISIQSRAAIKSENQQLKDRQYSWNIKNPKLGHHYEIRWTLPNTRPRT
jgi:hypothetical protein